MSRPTNKSSLLSAANDQFEKLLILLEETPEDFTFPEKYMNRNTRDVMGHLHHWHLMMMEWYRIGMSGRKPEMPAKGFTWKTVPQLNKVIHRQYQNTPHENLLRKLKHSHLDILTIIESHTDKELFTKKIYSWTGSTSLGAYLISSTSSHYDWAYNLIKKSIRLRRQERVPA